eukprot:6748728-Pyramimonas_sp.AAC.1
MVLWVPGVLRAPSPSSDGFVGIDRMVLCVSHGRQVGVELRVVPLTNQYWDRVVSHTIDEIKEGRTPNPDILCNSRVKFGAFVNHLEVRSSSYDIF